jgi:phenylpropionate dioxygenase-like ring-hydroxylating dioxygenase large terminal subunit
MNLLERSWHVVCAEHELQSPHRVELLDRALVVFDGRQGPAAIDASCIHRGTDLALGDVIDGCVRCPYHGWRFAADGRCVAIPSLATETIPSTATTRAYRAEVRDGLVWVSLDPHADALSIPGLPEAPAGMRTVTGEPMVWATSAGRHLENILDLAHFAFVHPASFGCPEAEVVQPHEVQFLPDGLSAEVDVVTRNPGAPHEPMYAGLGDTIRIGYRYEVTVPYRISLYFAFPDGMRRALHEVITPNRPDRCTIHWRLHVDERLESSDDDERAFALQVFSEDRPIIESQPAGVPLAATEELHVPADRLAVAYRRVLRDHGLTTADSV